MQSLVERKKEQEAYMRSSYKKPDTKTKHVTAESFSLWNAGTAPVFVGNRENSTSYSY